MSGRKFDVLSYIQSLGIPYKEKGKNVGRGWVGLKCPNCGDDPDYHLGVNLERGTFNCWRCGITGNFVKLVRLLEGVSLKTALRIANSWRIEGDPLVENDEKPPIKELRLPPYSYPFRSLNGNPLGRKALRYLVEHRKFSFSEIKDFYYCTGGSFAYRIVIPVYRNGKLVNYLGRSWNGREPKYLNCPNDEAIVPLSELVYPVNVLTNDFLVLTEGVFDALRVGVNAVALFGKRRRLSDAQIEEIAKVKPKNLIIMFDSDAEEDAEALGEFLWLYLPNVRIFVVVPDGGKDPADLTRKEILTTIKELIS